MTSLLTQLRLVILVICCFWANVSYGITSARTAAATPHAALTTPQVTTDIAKRAHSDVQMRKLLNLFASKKVDSSTLYERLREIKSKR